MSEILLSKYEQQYLLFHASGIYVVHENTEDIGSLVLDLAFDLCTAVKNLSDLLIIVYIKPPHLAF